jgi:hypothetical protein
MGFEPMNTGFADQRVSHFAIGAHECLLAFPRKQEPEQARITAVVLLSAGKASPSCNPGTSSLLLRSTRQQ